MILKIVDTSDHISFINSLDILIESSNFFNIGATVNQGGAIYINAISSVRLNSVLFESCESLIEGGALYVQSKKSLLNRVCFSNCFHHNVGASLDGSSARIIAEEGSISLTYSSIYMCSPKRESGYLSIRLSYGITFIENANCSHCKNQLNSGFGIIEPKESSEMKFCQISYMNADALHLDDCSLMNFNKINLVYNTEENCWAIKVFSTSSSDSITFTELVLWGNSRQINDAASIAQHTLIDCVSDKDFGSCKTQNCKITQDNVIFFDVDAPNNCKYERTTLGRICRRLIGLCFGLIRSSDAKH